MEIIKCKDCAFLDKCPSGQICVNYNKEFVRYCPVGKIKERKMNDA